MKILIAKLEESFDSIEQGKLTGETKFRDCMEWSSVNALILIAMVNVEFGVTVQAEDLIKMQTVQDLYDFIIFHKTE